MVVWDSSDAFGSEEQVANMFRFRNYEIDVQNHSWGNSTIQQLEERMYAHARDLEFEEAAHIRDQIGELKRGQFHPVIDAA